MASIVKQSSFLPLLLINFVGTLGFSIVLPFLVFVVITQYCGIYLGVSRGLMMELKKGEICGGENK
jgi:hypothetical protein